MLALKELHTKTQMCVYIYTHTYMYTHGAPRAPFYLRIAGVRMPTAHVSASCQRGFLVQRWLRFVARRPLRNVNPEESQMTSPYGICTALDGSDMEVS